MIDKLALIAINNNRLLCARSHGRELFFVPGGKRDPGESDQQALVREIQEELSVDITEDSIKFITTVNAPAEGKPSGIDVKMTCYQAEYSGEPKASAEIAEITWLSAKDKNKCSLATQKVFDWLIANNYLS